MRSLDGMLLLCIDRATTDKVMREVHEGVYRPHMGGIDRATVDKVMREVHEGVYGPHMGGHLLACKILRIGYF